MKKKFVLLLVVLVIFVGCNNANTSANKESVSTHQNGFVPPKDGKITKEQADRYINLAVKLESFILSQTASIDSFCKANNIKKEDIAYFTDTSYVKKHPNIIKEWAIFNRRVDEKMKEIYKECNMSEKEFEWVGGALIDPKNKDIQKYVEKRITEIKKGQKDEGKNS